VLRALRRLRVQVVCTFPGHPTSGALLAGDGWRRMRGVPGLDCFKAPAGRPRP
jgi:hypothetical protein